MFNKSEIIRLESFNILAFYQLMSEIKIIMKTKIIFVFYFFCNSIFAQQIIFEYSQKINRPSDDLNLKYQLIMEDDKSLAKVKDIKDITQIENHIDFDFGGINDSVVSYVYKNQDFPRFVRISEEKIFKSYSENQMFVSTPDNFKENHKVIKDSLDIFKWEFLEDVNDTIILNFHCKKAKTRFRGRDYVAYYSNEIANFGGPWKFDGLPGFIVKIYSIDGFIDINPISIKINPNYVSIIKNPFENKKFIWFKDLKNVILNEEREHFKRAKSANPYLTSYKKSAGLKTIEDLGLNYERKYE